MVDGHFDTYPENEDISGYLYNLDVDVGGITQVKTIHSFTVRSQTTSMEMKL